MRQALKKKIRSRRGASITFALLLFLVCAVVGSAVLTAGTVAAGRMSKIAEMDQRYYSVNSAARLVTEILEKEEIEAEIESSVAGDSFKFYRKDNSGRVQIEDSDSFSRLARETIKQILALRKTSDTKKTLSLTLKDTSSLIDDAKLDVTMTETILQNGDLEFEIKDTDGKYIIQMYLTNIGEDLKFRWKLNDMEITRQNPTSIAGETP